MSTKGITGRLFTRPSLFSGVARLFDFTGAFDAYNDEDDTPEEADCNAIRSDWQTVGEDLTAAMSGHKHLDAEVSEESSAG